MNSKIVPVILSGGAGTRLWPMSRPETPKQLLPLLSQASMLQMTAERTRDATIFLPPVIVTSAQHAGVVADQLAAAGVAPAQLILEPSARNTAAAIALAAFAAEPDALLLVMPSDHLIGNVPAFMEAVQAGAEVAAQDWLVTFGIRPTHAETGFGYIRRAEALTPRAHRAERFVEKPDAATAQSYLDQGCYDWNGGIFLFRAGAFLAALQASAPDIHRAVEQALPADRSGPNLVPDAEAFAAVRSQSVDHAVMEHAAKVAVVPVDMDWSDVGSWDALYAVGTQDAAGNHVSGPVAAIDTRGSLIKSSGPRVVTIGVQDLIVVATGDSVMILPRGASQRVREAAAASKDM